MDNDLDYYDIEWACPACGQSLCPACGQALFAPSERHHCPKCPDFPAPCNCDDPITHQGHSP